MYTYKQIMLLHIGNKCTIVSQWNFNFVLQKDHWLTEFALETNMLISLVNSQE